MAKDGPMKNKKILVTGAGGFIGSHLCEKLVKIGAGVTALVRYNSRGSLGFLENSPSEIKTEIQFVLGDIRDEQTFRMCLKDKDIVYHLAAVPGIPYSFIYPRDIFENNTLGSLNLLNAARETKPPKIVLASSGETYGDSRYEPMDEQHPQSPKSPYAASKAAMENYAWSFIYAYGMPITIVRLFNNYGPRQSARAVTPTIITQLLNSNEIKIGALHTKRDYTFVLDTVEALIKVAELSENGEVFNIGSNISVSVQQIIETVSKILGKKEIEIVADETRIRPGDSEVAALRADYTRLKEKTGWQPKYSYEEGLRITIEWIEKNAGLYKTKDYNI
jgi:nucleoside-diphosphate-sugar epimerase